MTDAGRSTRLFFALVVVVAALAAASAYLPQGLPTSIPETTVPIEQIALVASGSVLIFYGGLGYPDLLDPLVPAKQRFVIPGIAGLWLGLLFIVVDNIFARFHSLGPLPHPPFPTSLLASFSAGIGEEMIFRLFFIPALVWFISRVVLKGAQEAAVYWTAAMFSGMFFAAGHIPSIMLLLQVSSFQDIPTTIISEIFLLNGTLSLVAAHFLRRSGYLAAVTVHTATDLVWHVLWGLLR